MNPRIVLLNTDGSAPGEWRTAFGPGESFLDSSDLHIFPAIVSASGIAAADEPIYGSLSQLRVLPVHLSIAVEVAGGGS
jgi:hypothetical protein